MAAYYNEIDPFAAQWLRELIKNNLIAPGDVDERSIEDVTADDLVGYTQCHFFAGIGVWSYALRQAGWSDDKPIWTASCPCQPFSPSGKKEGFADERHLWPALHWLTQQCTPAILLGEQVAGKTAEPWIDLVQADVEALGYAFGCVPFPSAGVGAPHIRDRAYWVAHSSGAGLQERIGERRIQRETLGSCERKTVVGGSDFGGMADAKRQRVRGEGYRATGTASAGMQGEDREWQRVRSEHRAGGAFVAESRPAAPSDGFWRDADWLLCRDGRLRPVEPGTFPLAHGAAARMVCTCSHCKTETVIYEGMYSLRKVIDGHKGCEPKEVLRQRVLQTAQAINAINKQEYSALPSKSRTQDIVREMRGYEKASGSPQRQGCTQRFSEEFGDSLFEMPPLRTLEKTAFDVRHLWSEIQSGQPQKQEQDLFCPVCKGMGPHQCSQEVGPNRAGRLRGYGNAINAEAATAFIQAVMEVS